MEGRRGSRIVVICDHSYSFLRVLRGIDSYVRGQPGWDIEKLFADDPELIDKVRKAHPDGLITRVRSPEMAMHLRRVGCPLVSVYDDLPQSTFPRVMLNQSQVGRMGAEYLLKLEFRHLAFFGVDERWSIERERSFDDTVRRARGARPVTRRLTWPQIQQGAMALAVLRRLPRPVGLMAANDLIGVHLVETCHRLRLRVPEQVAVLGVDNEEALCEFAATPLSSVDTDAVSLGFEAASLLHRLLRGARPPGSPLLVNPRGVVSRRSTEARAVEDAEVQQAIRFIQACACDGIKVADVSREVMISRRMLELRFRKALNCSPGSEIRRVRVERAAELLRQSSLKLAEIADRCGYEHRTHLSAAFKQRFGITPKEYRSAATSQLGSSETRE